MAAAHLSMLIRPMRAVLALATWALCANAFAWGADGHQTVGKLADALLAGTTAQSRVRQIIGMSLEQASVWADCAKGVGKDASGGLTYQNAGRYRECGPFEAPEEQARMVGYVSRNLIACRPAVDEEPCHKQYHYTDVAMQRDHYAPGLVGTSDHDIVNAINATIVVLRGGIAPAPFQFDQREALLVLTHLVGDLHQPLHVDSIYLDAQGHAVDPDQGSFDPATRTVGANSIEDGNVPMHSQWDRVAVESSPARLGVSGVGDARAVPPTVGDPLTWSTLWATDVIQSAGPVFAQVTFAPEDLRLRWKATFPDGYVALRQAVQRDQLVKAGARLAQLLQAIWP